MPKPFAESCVENQQAILAILREEFFRVSKVLEVGSGTGQHAVFFARALPYLQWHTSDLAENHPGIQAWINDEGPDNVHPPLTLDVATGPWLDACFDAVFSANTAHIMGWSEVEKMFAGIGRTLVPGGRFCLYGPFNYRGEFTSPSNARFDTWLKQRDAKSGIRDVAALSELAGAAGLVAVADHEMPTNNRVLVWRAQ